MSVEVDFKALNKLIQPLSVRHRANIEMKAQRHRKAKHRHDNRLITKKQKQYIKTTIKRYNIKMKLGDITNIKLDEASRIIDRIHKIIKKIRKTNAEMAMNPNIKTKKGPNHGIFDPNKKQKGPSTILRKAVKTAT